MKFCASCGAPIITIYQNGRGMLDSCPECGAHQAAAGNENFSAAYAAAEALTHYVNQDFAAAADGFRKAAVYKYHAPELYWYAMLSYYGLRYFTNEEGCLFPTLWRFGLTDLMSEYEEYGRRCAEDLHGLKSLQRKYEELGAFLRRVASIVLKQPPQVFFSLKTEENGNPTKEKLLCDRITDLLDKSDQKFRYFYAPRNLEGITADYFEPCLYHALDTVAVFILFPDGNHLGQSIDLEWKRIQLRSEVRKYIVSDHNIPELNTYERLAGGSAEELANKILQICGGDYEAS